MRRVITVIIFIVIIFFVFKGWWNSQLTAVSSDKSTKVFIVTKGAGVSEIAKKLKEENLIKSELVFKIYIRQNNLTNKLQAGSYKLSPSMPIKDIAKALQVGSEDIWVTLVEGLRVEEMADVISSKFKIQSAKFIDMAKEGYMFPDTYLFPRQASVEYITQTLRETFDNRFSEELRSKIRSQGLSETQGIILASIVEREARSDEERKKVASVLLKRFKIGMALNADATLQYALGYQKDEKSWWKRHLTKEDKNIDSAYNTYLYNGLPPAPIANSGLSSLKAVAEADPSTPYLYYYHDSKGVSHYARTLEEHNQNVANYP